GIHAEGTICLHVDAICAVVVVEVVDVLRTHEDVQRGGDLRQGNAERLGLVAVHGDQHLRIVGGKLSEDAGELLNALAGGDNLVRHGVEVRERAGASVFEHELESAERADALHGGRLNDLHQAAVGR